MELTPDIVGRTAGFSDPWFDTDHDGDVASEQVTMEPLPSAVNTEPPRTRPRSVPPAPDTTFMLSRRPSSVATTSPSPLPDVAARRGNVDTLFSATWFYDASDAAEWRAVAEERRAAVQAARPAAQKRIPGWVLAVVMLALLMLVLAAASVLALTLAALVLLA